MKDAPPPAKLYISLPPEEHAGEPLTRYRFSLDGPRFARHVAAQLQEQLQGTLPPGVEIQPAAVYETMTGQGELWVDEAGYPRRQVLDLQFPRLSREYQVQAHIAVDFSTFGAVTEQTTVVPDAEGGWRVETQPLSPPAARSGGLTLPSREGWLSLCIWAAAI